MAQTDQQRQDGLVITTAVFTSLAFIAVALRSVVRLIVIRKAGWDDYLIIAAMVMSAGYFAEVLVAKANHIGFSAALLTPENMVNFMKVTLAIQLTYYACVSFIKISILCMYMRFLATDLSRLLCKGTIIFHALFLVVCMVTTGVQCVPIEKMWNPMLPGNCINGTAFFYFTSGFNILTDIWIIALPIKSLLKIQRPGKEKIALVAIFGVGTFATIVSIIRLHTIYTYTLAKDPFQQGILVNLWSVIEINVGIVCASVPALKPLFTPALLRATRERSSGPKPSDYSRYESKDRSGYIRSKMSVDQTWAETGANHGPLPYNNTEITGGGRNGVKDKDSDSTVEMLPV